MFGSFHINLKTYACKGAYRYQNNETFCLLYYNKFMICKYTIHLPSIKRKQRYATEHQNEF
jgi:hypothetical protein